FDKKKWEAIVEGMGEYTDKYEKNPLPVVATSLFMSSAFGVNEALKILLGMGTPAYNKLVYFNQRGSDELTQTPGFLAMTHAFSEHFRAFSKRQGFDWDSGWRGNYLEELEIECDPGCPVCAGVEKEQTQSRPIAASAPITGEPQLTVTTGDHTAPGDDSSEGDEKNNGNLKTVALLVNPGANMAAALFGVLKAAKTYVPLSPTETMERLRFIIINSGARVILSDEANLELSEKLRENVNRNIAVVNLTTLVSPTNDDTETLSPGMEIKPGQIACMTYPPGTGEPVMESHETILEFVKLYTFNQHQLAGNKPPFSSTTADSFKAVNADFYCDLLSGTGDYVFEKIIEETPSAPASLSTILREHLLEELPNYMIPSYFIKLEKIPLTPNGKVDHRALSQLEISSDQPKNHIPPRNDIEKKLNEIWADVLNVPQEEIGIDSNFFQMGGHSLKATVLTARIHKIINIKLLLTEIFKNPSIRTLADTIKGKTKKKFTAIEPTEKKEYHILSSAQNRFYLLQQLEPESVAYNVSGAYILEGETCKEKLEDTFNRLILRQESLRTSFEIIDEQPVQRVHSHVEFQIPSHKIEIKGNDLSDIPGFVAPFDLSRTPLIRVRLVEAGLNRHILQVDMHHI
ncbi:MAG: AMP-binding protein, partial [bacterium]|nr:AMP-binding protein [bacterium]